MFSPQELTKAYEALAHGAARLDGIQHAIDEADAAKNASWGLEFRYAYMEEATFHDDNYKSILMFPATLALYDANPQLQEEFQYKMMWAYKHMVEHCVDYYQISSEQTDAYFDAYKERCNRYGYTLRSYHMKRMMYYYYADRSKALESYHAYRDTQRDKLGDCVACETTAEMKFELAFGTEEQALALARPILEGELSCGEIPEVTYCYLMQYYMNRGDHTNATHYARLMHPLIQGNPAYLMENSELMRYYAATDLIRGVQVFRACVGMFATAHNPRFRLYFCNGAAKLFAAIHTPETLHLRLPKALACWREDGVYDTQKLSAWFQKEAEELAALFDKRNGTDFYTQMVHTALAGCENVSGLALPQSAIVERRTSFIAAVPRDESQLSEAALPQLLQRLEQQKDITLLSVEFDDVRECPYVQVRFDDNAYGFHIMVQQAQETGMLRQLHYIPEETIAAVNKATLIFMLAMEFGADAQRSFQLQIKLLRAMLPDTLALLDFTRMTILSADWATLATVAPVPPAAEYLFSTHVQRGEKDGSFWLFTCGLQALGVRDLELIGVTEENVDAAFNLLNAAASRVVELGSLPDAGEMMHVGRLGNGVPMVLTWQSPEQALQQFADDVFGGKNDRADVDPNTGIVLAYPTKEDYDSRRPSPVTAMSAEALADFSPVQSNRSLYLVAQLAKSRYAWLCKGFAHADKAIVRVEVELDEAKRAEFDCYYDLLWMTPEKIDETGITGTLLESSDMLEHFTEGSRQTIPAERISDFQFRIGDEVLAPDSVYLLPYILKDREAK